MKSECCHDHPDNGDLATQTEAQAEETDLRAVNAKLTSALEGLIAQEETRLRAWKITDTQHLDHAREAIKEARK